MANAPEGESINAKEISYSILERYLLFLDWLKDSPQTLQLLQEDYLLHGENSGFRLNTFYTSAFKNLSPDMKHLVTAAYLKSNPKWTIKEFQVKCVAIPRRGEAQQLLEKAVAEAAEAKVDQAGVAVVCSVICEFADFDCE